MTHNNIALWIHIPNQVGTVSRETIDVGARRVQLPSEKVAVDP